MPQFHQICYLSQFFWQYRLCLSGGGVTAGVTTVEITQDYPISKKFKEWGEKIATEFKNASSSSGGSGQDSSQSLSEMWESMSSFWTTIKGFFESSSQSFESSLRSMAEIVKDPSQSYNSVKGFAQQTKFWMEIFKDEWSDVKQILEVLWDNRVKVFNEIRPVISGESKTIWDMMSTINDNKHDWVRAAQKIAEGLGGWQATIGSIIKDSNQLKTALSEIGKNWSSIRDVAQTIVKNQQKIWEIKDSICGSNKEDCAKIFKHLTSSLTVNKLMEEFKWLSSNMTSLEQSLEDLQKEVDSNKDMWQGLIPKIKENKEQVQKFFAEKEGKNKLKDLLTGQKLQQLKQTWELLKESSSSGNSKLQSVLIEEGLKDPEKFINKMDGLIKQFGGSRGSSSINASGSHQLPKHVLSESALRQYFAVKPGVSEDIFAGFLAVNSILGGSDDENSALLVRSFANVAGTLFGNRSSK